MTKSLFPTAVIVLGALVSFVPDASAAPPTPSPTAQPSAGCAAKRYDFPNAINTVASAPGVLNKDARRSIVILGRQGLKMGCNVTVVCGSVDNSKPAFEAVKVYCKTARDAIAAGRPDDSAAKRQILTSAKRPKDGYKPGSLALLLK